MTLRRRMTNAAGGNPDKRKRRKGWVGTEGGSYLLAVSKTTDQKDVVIV